MQKSQCEVSQCGSDFKDLKVHAYIHLELNRVGSPEIGTYIYGLLICSKEANAFQC